MQIRSQKSFDISAVLVFKLSLKIHDISTPSWLSGVLWKKQEICEFANASKLRKKVVTQQKRKQKIKKGNKGVESNNNV